MTLSEFRQIRAKIQPYIRNTPVVPCEIDGLYLKLENLQYTHAFKVRGAFARMLEVVDAEDHRTILTVSAGNHGQAVARAAATFQRPCVVVVPECAPKAKIDAIRNYGIELQSRGSNYDETEKIALAMAGDTTRYVFISPYDDRTVVLGQGSLAFEIIEQAPQTATIIVPVGGGGLLAGIAAAAKQLCSEVRVIGVQAEVSAAIYESL